jgi:type III pantothenate kinase
MTPDVVVDIGNSRMKWGLCRSGRVREKVSLPLSQSAAWSDQLTGWNITGQDRWAVAGVNPPRLRRFLSWLGTRAGAVATIDHWHFNGLTVAVDKPTQVGIDRLLTALAARRIAPADRPVIVINVGTAMTVDLIDVAATFAGGAILPGPTLMARSLHDYTAKLPRVSIDPVKPLATWGRNTRDAIELGIGAAITGAADFLVWEWANRFNPTPSVHVTGGDSGYFSGFEFTADVGPAVINDNLTLEGIRLAAEALP